MLVPERCLISVSDKTGVVDFARRLSAMGIEMISTGGTARVLSENGITVTKVEAVTGFPEMLDGRVKTLHPRILAGILALRNETHLGQLDEHDIKPIDMVVVNLYPFEDTISRTGVSLAEAIENIDIGGPSMIRAAAKNFEDVAVIVNPKRYQSTAEELENSRGLSAGTLKLLALEAFEHTAVYDSIIYNYLHGQFLPDEFFPRRGMLNFIKKQDMRYGENAHQRAAFYIEEKIKEVCVSNAVQIHGRELSFNNILDLDAALELVKDFKEPAASVIKHTNPCGFAVKQNITDAYRAAYAADTLSAFGCVVGLNRSVTKEIADDMSKVFIEAVIAPSYDDEAREMLRKKKNIRLLRCGDLSAFARHGMDIRKVVGGFLIQDRDTKEITEDDLKVVAERKPTAEEMKNMLFAWKVIRHVKSNSIVYAKDTEIIGVGAGQMSRVVAAEIASKKAGEKAKGAVMASDAFFPFRDGVDAAGKVGISAIIQPGGSIRDREVIDAANEYGMAMVFTAIRAFRH